MMADPIHRPQRLHRRMAKGAIAGTVVGAVFGTILLVFCLYPVIVYLLKRRSRRRSDSISVEPEVAFASAARSHSAAGSPPCLEPLPGYEIKHGFGLPLGPSTALVNGRDSSWTPRTAVNGNFDFAPGPPRQPSATTFDPSSTSVPDLAVSQPFFGHYGLEPSPYLHPGGEFMPQSLVYGNQPGALRGASAEYYSPWIPSEAFGMVSPDMGTNSSARAASPTPSPSRFLSRNVRHMFRRNKARHQQAAHVVEPANQRHLENTSSRKEPDSFPVALPPTATDVTVPATQLHLSPPLLSAETPQSVSPPSASSKASPQRLSVESSLKASPPPSCPAPGTVNPMDVMPASTESEVWHQTERLLFVSSCELPSDACLTAARHPDTGLSSPAAVSTPVTGTAEAVFLAQVDPRDNWEQLSSDLDLALPDLQPYHHDPTPSAKVSSTETTNYADQSTPFPQPVSANLSSHTTPSTLIDSPTPESRNSSDFQHSLSPQSGRSAPKVGEYRCEEVGCNQAFDQPHKLKHHQRYHSKDHKCPYAHCGKGFGTKTHLQRHINDRHEKKKKFHCSVPACEYSRAGGKAFPRKDNWKRHMTRIHGMHQHQLPEPVEIEVEASAT